MPELPEVETTKQSLNPLIGKTIKSLKVFQPKLRWMIPENLSDELVGYTLKSVDRRAKYLILNFHINSNNSQNKRTNSSSSDIKKVIIHLGMSGSLQQVDVTVEKQKHDHLIIEFDNYNQKLIYHDPRRFGAVLWYEGYAEKLLNHLAPEPLSELFNADYLYQKLQKTSKAIKVSVMDQKYVVGVGNIYATESLFLSSIHPLTPSNALSKDQVNVLVDYIKQILQKAIQLGGSSLNDFTYASGKTGFFQQTLYAYGRAGEPCVQCQTILETIKITNRASCFCPNCQKLG